MVIVIIALLLNFNIFATENINHEWILIKTFTNNLDNPTIYKIYENNVDIDIKLTSKGKTISIQNGPEVRGSIDYIVIKPSNIAKKYYLYIRPTTKTGFIPKVEVSQIQLFTNNEFLYYQIIYRISQSWYTNDPILKKQALALCDRSLMNKNNKSKYNELLSICAWVYIGLETYKDYFDLINQINIDDVIDKYIRYKLQYSKSKALNNFGKFSESNSAFQKLFSWLDHDNNLNLAWILNKELIRGNIGLTKALISYHSNNGKIDGLDEINTSIINISFHGEYQINATLFQYLATYYGFVNEKNNALAALDIALENVTKSQSTEGLNVIHNQIGITYVQLNQIKKAQFHYRKTLQYLNRDLNPNVWSLIMLNIARTYFISGNNQDAFRYYKKALLVFSKMGSEYYIAYIHSRLGTIERLNGNFDKAVEYHLMSIETFNNISNSRYIESVNELGLDFLENNKNELAIKFALCALIIDTLNNLEVLYHNENRKLVLINNEFSTLLNDKNKFSYLKKLNVKKLKYIYKKVKHSTKLITNNNNFISKYIASKASLNMLNTDSLNNDLKSLTNYSDFNLIPLNQQLDFWELKIDYYRYIDDYENLYSTAQKTLLAINETRRKLDISDQALHWADQAKLIINKYVSALLMQNKYREIFILLEKYYSINLREKRHNSTNEIIKEKSERILQALDDYVTLERQTLLLNDFEIQNQADEAKEHFLALDINIESPNIKIALGHLSIEQVQEKLADDELFLRYYINDNNAFVYVIEKNAYKIKQLPNSIELHKIVKKIINSIKSKRFNNLVNQGYIYERILPHEQILSQKYRKIIIIPDGILNLMPFSSINISQSEGEYIPLATQIEIERTYSASEYFSKINIESNADTITVFANPIFLQNSDNQILKDQYSQDNKLWEFKSLPYTDKEAQYIADIYSDSKINLLNGKYATNENLLSEQTRNSNIIHIATHGFFNDKNLDNVGIATSIIDKNGGEAPGILAMREILYYPFKANLAVISGCETTLGKEISGEGFNSLSRGLLSQGVNSVIGTIWSISDRATPVFMKEFYTNLKDMNGNVSKALNTTKSNFATQPKFRRYRHPYYWAGFVLTSSNRGISEDIFN